MEVHHIGYLVKRLEKAAAAFQALGYVPEGEAVYDPGRDVDIQFLLNGGCRVELVSPRSAASVVAKLLKVYKNAPYHICYTAEDFSAELERLERSGFLRIDEPAPAPALGGRKVCFLMCRQTGMAELLESER